MNGVWHGGGTGLTDGRRAGGPAFSGGAALARVPGGDGRRWGGRVSGGISLPGPAFPFLPAAFPVGLFLPAPFLPLPGLLFLCLRRASSSWRLASRSWRCRRFRLPLAAGFLFCRRRTSAPLALLLPACRRWRSRPAGLPALPGAGGFAPPAQSLLLPLDLPFLGFLGPLDLPFLGFLGPLGLSLLGLLLAAEQLFLRCCSRASFSSLAWASSCCRASASRWRKAIFSCWRSCRLARRSSLVRSWNRRTSPMTTRTKADQQQQPDIDVSQNGCSHWYKGHKRGEGHVVTAAMSTVAYSSPA